MKPFLRFLSIFFAKKYIAYTMLYTNGNDLLDVIRHRITEFNEPKNK